MKVEESAVFWRAVTTMTIWVMLLAAIIIVSIFLPATLGEDIIAVFLFLAIAAAVATGAVWSGVGNKSKTKTLTIGTRKNWETEKTKNDRLANALRQLSDDELIRLREKVASGELDDRSLATLIDDV